jgi:hypothetical protein
VSAIDRSEPAFPKAPNEWEPAGKDGMTLRDYFAARSMHAILAEAVGEWVPADYDQVAARAYRMADAMLKARAA